MTDLCHRLQFEHGHTPFLVIWCKKVSEKASDLLLARVVHRFQGRCAGREARLISQLCVQMVGDAREEQKSLPVRSNEKFNVSVHQPFLRDFNQLGHCGCITIGNHAGSSTKSKRETLTDSLSILVRCCRLSVIDTKMVLRERETMWCAWAKICAFQCGCSTAQGGRLVARSYHVSCGGS